MAKSSHNDSSKKSLLPNFWEEDDYKPEEKKKEPVGNRKYQQGKRTKEYRKMLKKEEVAKVLDARIEPETSVHVVTNGSFDFWNVVVRLIELHELKACEFLGCTWTMNDQNVQSLMGLIDDGTIRSASVLVGLYFLHREPVVADLLKEGLASRAQRFKAHDNHAKVVLLSNGTDYLVIEASANFTANPRIEQFVVNNDQGLYEFHKDWMNAYHER